MAALFGFYFIIWPFSDFCGLSWDPLGKRPFKMIPDYFVVFAFDFICERDPKEERKIGRRKEKKEKKRKKERKKERKKKDPATKNVAAHLVSMALWL